MPSTFELLKSFAAPIVSAIAAFLSFVYFVRTSKLSRLMADRSIYVEGQKFVIEICKQLISEPLLWCIYDDYIKEDDRPEIKNTPFERKMKAFAHLHLNMFEIVLAEAPNSGSGERQNQSNVWIRYFHDTLRRCSIVRDVLEDETSKDIWNPVLIEMYGDWKRQQQHVSW
jgi:hypothetical protein